jgi:hypothetical protein
MRPGGASRGLWRILDGKVRERHVVKFEALRWWSPSMSIKDHIGWALWNKIDYVLAHMGFMGSYKLSSFDSR